MEINKTGIWGEVYAARYLRDNGYKIITSNYRSRLGEIDIIAQKDKNICFVEVKARGENPIAEPMEAVDAAKQKRIIATSKLFLKAYEYKLQPQFDVCEVRLNGNFEIIKINYIENAYSAE